jgi:hypothetical protein
MVQLGRQSGSWLGWPIYKVLDIDEKLVVVTLRLQPGKRGLAEIWGDIAFIEDALFTKLEGEGVRVGDHIQWGTRDGVPFLMDLSDLIFLS